MGSTAPLLTDLASQVSQNAEIIQKFLEKNNIADLSFDVDSSSSFPVDPENRDIYAARFALIDSAKQIQDLVTGPDDTIKWQTMNYKHITAAYHVIYHFKIAQAVPDKGSITFPELAKATGVHETIIARVIRALIPGKIFAEPKSGQIAHTPMSKLLARDKYIQAWVGHNTEDIYVSEARFVDAIEKFGFTGEPSQTGFNLAFNTNDTYWEYAAKHPQLQARFSDSMIAAAGKGVGDAKHLATLYPWEKLQKGSTIVDIGGSVGHVSIAIAERFPHLNFVIQDLPDVEANAHENIPEEMKSRMSFQPHNFFDPQPVKAAEVYILRQILHDWSDQYSIKILKQILAAMSSDSRLIIMDSVLPEPNTIPAPLEQFVRSLDLQMLTVLNACERSVQDWESLLERVDPAFKIEGITRPDASQHAILEIRKHDKDGRPNQIIA
ncbi:MAG: hypothetical protein M1819_003652 [Sarea resinae]|nr:MAG: hypothetical protein M1819_003652 [Sarea resinae]